MNARLRGFENNLAIRRPKNTGRFRSLFYLKFGHQEGSPMQILQRKYCNQRLADPGEDQYSQLSQSDHFVNNRFVSQLNTVSRALS